jgi:hypothetical protein
MPTLKPLTREQLAKFLPDHEAVKRFEDLFQATLDSAPSADVSTLVESLSNDLSSSRSEIQRLSSKINQLEAMILSMLGPASLTGPIRSTGNTTSIAAQTGSGTTFAMQDSPSFNTPALNVATATSINKMSITAPASASTLAVADGKTFTVSRTLTITGTDGTVMTFPSTSATIARTDAAQTFTGTQTFDVLNATGVFTNTRSSGADTYINHVTSGTNNQIIGYNNSGITNGSGVVNNDGYIGSLNAYSTSVIGNGALIARFVSTAQGPQGLNVNGIVTVVGGASLITTSSAMNNGAGVSLGTLTNAPAAGNPTKWVPFDDNGTTRYFPSW